MFARCRIREITYSSTCSSGDFGPIMLSLESLYTLCPMVASFTTSSGPKRCLSLHCRIISVSAPICTLALPNFVSALQHFYISTASLVQLQSVVLPSVNEQLLFLLGVCQYLYRCRICRDYCVRRSITFYFGGLLFH
jgi:hypothetical protein